MEEPQTKSPDHMEIDAPPLIPEEPSIDIINKLHSLEILPDIFNLLHDLETGAILAKDFDNNAGSIRLKLATLKQYLQEVEGINESIETRTNKIETLRNGNSKKYQFLTRFKEKVESDINV